MLYQTFDHCECGIDFERDNWLFRPDDMLTYEDRVEQGLDFFRMFWGEPKYAGGSRFYRKRAVWEDMGCELAFEPRTANNRDFHLTLRGQFFRTVGSQNGDNWVHTLAELGFHFSRLDLAWDCVETFGDWLPDDVDPLIDSSCNWGIKPRRGVFLADNYNNGPDGVCTGWHVGKDEVRLKVYDKLLKDPEWCALTWPGALRVFRLEIVVRGNTLKDQGKIVSVSEAKERLVGVMLRRWRFEGSFDPGYGFCLPRVRSSGSLPSKVGHWRRKKEKAARMEDIYAALDRESVQEGLTCVLPGRDS